MNGKQILIVEDEPTCQIILTQTLAFKYKLELATTIARAKELFIKQKPDLILLDFYLPDGDAFSLIEFIKSIDDLGSVPIILLTQESAPKIKVRSFSEGVYDFITKPFDSTELLARIESHLGRAEEINKTTYQPERVGDLVFDAGAHSMSLNLSGGLVPLKLSPVEYKILYCLMANVNKVRTREQLAMAAWKRKYFQIRTIDRHISSIRKKLGPCATYLRTVSQGGYRLSPMATSESTSEASL